MLKLIFVKPNIVTAKAILIKLPQILLGKREAHQVIKNKKKKNRAFETRF